MSTLSNLRLKNYNKVIIGNININSIGNKFEQLKKLMKDNIDILVITETKIDDSFTTAQLMIDGYSKPYRKDRDVHGGGILIYVRENILSKELDKHSFPCDVEGIFIELNFRTTKWLLLGTYHPPSQTHDYYFDYLERAIDIYTGFYDNFILIGDFNTEDTEPQISRFLHQYDANNLVKEPTCFKNPDNPSCIDLFLTNKRNSFQNTLTVSTGLSDFHKMAATVLKTTYRKPKPKEIVYRNYKKLDKELFRAELKNAIMNGEVTNYHEFEKTFLKILNKHAPIKRRFIRANDVPYMTKALRKAIMRRSQLETKFHKTRKKADQIACRKQKNFVSRLYKKERKKFYNDLNLKDLADNKKFWKLMQPLFSEKTSTKHNITIVSGDEIITEDSKVAETMNKFFQTAATSLDIRENSYLLNTTDIKDSPVHAAIEKFSSHPSILKIQEMIPKETFSFVEVTVTEVENELSNLNSRKANTSNGIPTKMLKDTSDVCGPVLHFLINQAISDGEFPNELKLADITPSFKKEDPTSVKNYRPISVLPAMSKVYERLIQKQLVEFMDKRLSRYLCGYRKGYNSQYALVSLIERWKKTLDQQGYAAAMLMDLSKAFDTINHELLIAKLHAYGFSLQALKLVHSYLTNRWQRTKINRSFSSWTELLLGVPQGSVLGPLLFNIYINDLFWVNSLSEVCNYADDTTFYACNADLESVLHCLEHDSLLAVEWFENNYMQLNSDKCHLLISGFKHQIHWASIGDTKVWESSNEKLLGLTIDRDLKFDLHISKICNKANRKLSALNRISKLLPLNKRKLLFSTFIESQFAYCPLVWMFHDRNVHNRINRLHARALRIVYQDDVSSFEELLSFDKSFTVHERNIQKLATELYKCKHNLANVAMQELFYNSANVRPNLRKAADFVVPRVNTVHKGDDSLRHLGPLIWEIVPEALKALSIKKFKEEVKKWKPAKCPCRLCKPYIQGVGYLL